MTKTEGYIKYNCRWVNEQIGFEDAMFRELNYWREKLFLLKLIGSYPNGVGFGNISHRYVENKFIITGSATGHKPVLTIDDYAFVTEFDIDQNEISCIGKTKASSESMSHAVLYDISGEIESVIHVHHKDFWKALKKEVPVSKNAVEFGTPEMAHEIKRLYQKTDFKKNKIMVMGGHEEGILVFGKSLEEAGKILINSYNNFIS